jgi:hypothetical protein
MLFAIISTLLLMATVFATKAKATELPRTGLDLHKLWHNKCASCHGHSAEFSRKFLRVSSEGKLLGPLHADNLKLFLFNHYPAGKEVDGIYNMLLAQASTQPRFQQECSDCHGIASEFVRESLILRDGELLSRKLQSSTSSFLGSHRGLSAEDVEFFVEQLTRIANEIYRP